ncbi:MAG: hypothetical protein F4Y44_07935 [Chloroflexi bacterium]|nr:hypothetical protein [Chloroflexota bacterium]
MLLLPLLRDSDSLRVSWSIAWGAFFSGIFMSVFLTLLHRVGTTPVPAPVFTTHPIYQRAEIVVSLACLAAVAMVFLLSS